MALIGHVVSKETRDKISRTLKSLHADPNSVFNSDDFKRKKTEGLNKPEVVAKNAETMTKLWEDEDFRKRQVESHIRYASLPGSKIKMSDAMKSGPIEYEGFYIDHIQEMKDFVHDYYNETRGHLVDCCEYCGRTIVKKGGFLFHHRIGRADDEGNFAVLDACHRNLYTIERIKEEIDKTDRVCRGCHSKIHNNTKKMNQSRRKLRQQ